MQSLKMNALFVMSLFVMAGIGCQREEGEKSEVSKISPPEKVSNVEKPAIPEISAPKLEKPAETNPMKSSVPPKATPSTMPPKAHEKPAIPVVDPNKPAPKIVFKEKEHNFGTVFEGDPCVYAFEFKNEGPGDLVITNVQPSCGCTTKRVTLNIEGAEKEYVLNSPIPPGTTGHIEATLASLADKKSQLSVFCNDPVSPTTSLQVAVKVEKFFNVEPAIVALGQVFGKVGSESTVKISCLKAESFNIKSWEGLPEGVQFEFVKPDPAKPNYGELKIKVLSGQKEGPVNAQTVLHVEVAGMDKPRDIRLPVMGSVLGAVQFLPPTFLGLSIIPKGQTQVAKITVQNRDPKTAMHVTEVSIDSAQKEFLSTAIKTELEGQTYVVELTVNDQCPIGMVKGNIMIKTDHPEMTEKKIGFSGVIRDLKAMPQAVQPGQPGNQPMKVNTFKTDGGKIEVVKPKEEEKKPQ